jgi:prolyl-tRNA synthetase
MKYSRYLLPTMKETPSEAELISHKLMLRAGFMRRLAAGIYSYLPLGYRVIRKIEEIIRQEMNKSGAQEVFLPVLSPAGLWEESGRLDQYGPELMRVEDRHNRTFCLGPTHEEVITDLVRCDVRSYRQLPLNLYQIQTKFRDEIRPRFGIMRAREFIMKDGYSFDRDSEEARKSYQAMSEAYERVFSRCGLEYRAVEADSGPIGGDVSQEFMVLADSGEDKIAVCDLCKYAANQERAETRKPTDTSPPPPTPKQIEKVHTPNLHTVEEVSTYLKCRPRDLVKTLIVKAEYTDKDKSVAVLIRGDHELNETKLKNYLQCNILEMADPQTVEQVTGAPVGFAGPAGLKGIPIIADHAIGSMADFVTGANLADYHYINVNREADFEVSEFSDLVNVCDGDLCPKCEGKLKLIKGIEVGHIFILGTKYSTALSCNFLDEQGNDNPMVMGCYGIGVGRTAAAAVEQNHDEHGIIWPYPIAPFQVLIVPLDVDEHTVMDLAESLYNTLTSEGVEVLLDDRHERPGAKFKDADLIGIPLRITIGARDLKKKLVEIKERKTGAVEKVAPDKVLEAIREKIRIVSG